MTKKTNRFAQINYLVDEVLRSMPKGSRTQQLVLLVMWRMATPSGAVRINKTQLGRMINLETRQVSRALLDLEEWGHIKRLPHKSAHGWPAYAIRYRPTPP